MTTDIQGRCHFCGERLGTSAVCECRCVQTANTGCPLPPTTPPPAGTPTDTPRTDFASVTTDWASGEPVVPADFARQLERELAAALKEIAYFKDYVLPEKDNYGRYWHDLAQERIAKLSDTTRELDKVITDTDCIHAERAESKERQKALIEAWDTIAAERRMRQTMETRHGEVVSQLAALRQQLAGAKQKSDSINSDETSLHPRGASTLPNADVRIIGIMAGVIENALRDTRQMFPEERASAISQVIFARCFHRKPSENAP